MTQNDANTAVRKIRQTMAIKELLKLCHQFAMQLKDSPGDLLYQRYEKSDRLVKLLQEAGCYQPLE